MSPFQNNTNQITIGSLHMKTSAYRSILDHMTTCYPTEGCGLLLQQRSDNEMHSFDRFEPIPNYSSNPLQTFHLDPAVYIALLYRYPDSKWSRVLVHSHPTSPAHLSREDKLGLIDAQALWTGYLIISFQQGIDKPECAYYSR